ncbi:MAG: BLUF domain-containing protein [Sphingomonas sp.]|nr:BLUF domain-containing protein [Sphingomonas sp.]RZV50220.1 MAG: BLUF domain-containing protein [Sphingomonadaceae bacterium]
MLRLAFSSIMAEPMDGAAIDDLVARCRDYNTETGITGSVIVGGNRFAEIIEGDCEEVTATFRRICRDRRHLAIVMLGKRETDVRLFPGKPLDYDQIAPLGSMMSLAQMARELRNVKAHASIYKPLRQYSSFLAAA